MKNWLWLVLIPSLAFAAKPASLEMGKNPVYVDVKPQKIIIHPEMTEIAVTNLAAPENEFKRFLDQAENVRYVRRVILVLRPGSARLQRQLRQMIRDRGIEVALEPLETGRALIPEEIQDALASAPRPPAPAPPAESMGGLKRIPAGIGMENVTVLVATPREMPEPDKCPVFFECRGNQLFPISLEDIRKACDEKTAALRVQANQDEAEFLRLATQAQLELDGQRIDYTYALMGKYVLLPIPDAQGETLDGELQETDGTGYGARLAALDPDKQDIRFFVRPDGIETFRKARKEAWDCGIEADCEFMDEQEPIMLGPGGASRIFID